MKCEQAAAINEVAWQPIETAPKDRRVLLSDGESCTVGQWRRFFFVWAWVCDDFSVIGKPTHWMELPPKPETP